MLFEATLIRGISWVLLVKHSKAMPSQFSHPPLPQTPTSSGCGGETCDLEPLVHVLSDSAKMRGDRSSWTPQTGAEKVHVQPRESLKRFNVTVDRAFLSKACQVTFAIWPLPSPLLPAEMRTEWKDLSRTKRGLTREAKRLNMQGNYPTGWPSLRLSEVFHKIWLSKCRKEANWMENSFQVQVRFSKSHAESWEGKELWLSHHPTPARAMPAASLGSHFHFT